MGIEDGFGKTSGLEQGETEQNRVAQGGPYGLDDVNFRGNVLDQDGIDADTDHDEKSLEGQGQKGAKIILPIPPHSRLTMMAMGMGLTDVTR